MYNTNLQLHYKRLIEKRDNYKRELAQARKMYDKELDKHIRIVLYGGIISIIIFLYLKLRESYNFFLAEIVFSQMVEAPLTYALIIMLIIILRSSIFIFLMTRKNKIKIYKWRIQRGIPDLIEQLEMSLAKAEYELEEFEKEFKDSKDESITIADRKNNI